MNMGYKHMKTLVQLLLAHHADDDTQFYKAHDISNDTESKPAESC